jgi:hypothetical protein
LYQRVHYGHPHSPGAEDDVKLGVVWHPLCLLLSCLVRMPAL